jgi:peptide/nickel transport system substrate-binding protein/oligopeptide transport system substrate-binding protein
VLLRSVLAAALLWPALATGQPREGARAAAVYRRPLANEPATLDPARINDIYSRSVAQQIFDGLVRFDHTLAITPALAEFWRASRDGLTWTFNLRKGVRFHHGREVTADDVVFSLSRILDPRLKSGAADVFLTIRGAREYRDGRAATVAGLVALDPHTVQITLSEAFSPFVSVLALGHAKILPRDAVEQAGEAFGARPVGTGPFRLAQWEPGKSITLVANRDYFDGPPKLARVVYRIFPGGQADSVYEEFKRGQLEDAPPPARDYRNAVTAKGHVYVRRPMFSVRFYGFNTRVKPLDDRRVREAITLAVDRGSIVDDIFLGRHALARGILPPGTLGYNPKIAGAEHDPARARALLAQAGYPGGRGLPTIHVWSSGTNDAIVREHAQMKRDLEAVGIRAEFNYLTNWPAFSRMLAEGRAPMFLYAWFADVPDPDNFLYQLFHSRSPRNYTGYANGAVDDLLLSARNAPNAQRRVELYRRAEQLILDDAPVLPVWHYNYERLFQPYVKSVEVNGLGDPYIPLRKIWLELAR